MSQPSEDAIYKNIAHFAHPSSASTQTEVVSSKNESRWSHNDSFKWPSNILEFTRSLQKLKSMHFDIQYNTMTAEPIPANQRVQHHWTFKLAKLVAPKIPYDPQYWVDFFGVKTDLDFDIIDNSFAPWLVHTKREHESLGKTLQKGDLIPIGIFPSFDQDYYI